MSGSLRGANAVLTPIQCDALLGRFRITNVRQPTGNQDRSSFLLQIKLARDVRHWRDVAKRLTNLSAMQVSSMDRNTLFQHCLDSCPPGFH